MVRLNCCDADWPLLSVTFMVKVKVSTWVGVPASPGRLGSAIPSRVSTGYPAYGSSVCVMVSIRSRLDWRNSTGTGIPIRW